LDFHCILLDQCFFQIIHIILHFIFETFNHKPMDKSITRFRIIAIFLFIEVVYCFIKCLLNIFHSIFYLLSIFTKCLNMFSIKFTFQILFITYTMFFKFLRIVVFLILFKLINYFIEWLLKIIEFMLDVLDIISKLLDWLFFEFPSQIIFIIDLLKIFRIAVFSSIKPYHHWWVLLYSFQVLLQIRHHMHLHSHIVRVQSILYLLLNLFYSFINICRTIILVLLTI